MHDSQPPAFIPPTSDADAARTAPPAPAAAAIERTPRAELAFIPPGIWLDYLERWAAETRQRAA